MNLPKCPLCNEDYTRRVRREGLVEHLISKFYIYPFRCQLCGERFRARQRGVRYVRVDEDRREYERVAVAYDATLAAEREQYQGVVTNISLGGCAAYTDAPLFPGAILQLGLKPPGYAHAITIDAALVRTSRPNNVGMEFIRFKDDERIRLKELVRSLHPAANAPAPS